MTTDQKTENKFQIQAHKAALPADVDYRDKKSVNHPPQTDGMVKHLIRS